MKLSDAYKDFWKNYVNFKDDATRKQYWTPTLIHSVIYILLLILILTFVAMKQGTLVILTSLILIVFVLSIFIPSLAIQVRRLHDINRKGFLVYLNLFTSFLVGFISGFISSSSHQTENINIYTYDPITSIIAIINLIISIWIFIYLLLPTSLNKTKKRKWL